MAFHLSAQDLWIEDGRYLKGQLQNVDGDFVDATIDLDEFLGNENGEFQWDGENFSMSAEGIDFTVEGDDRIPVLRAILENAEGEPVEANINLAERIANEDGQFVFQ